MNRRIAICVIAGLSVSAAAFMVVGQPADAPTDNQPAVDPAMDAAAQQQAEEAQAAQDAADAMDAAAAAAAAAGDAAPATTRSSTEPSTQDTTEPTTGPAPIVRAKPFSRTTSRPTARGAVRWSGKGPITAVATSAPADRPMSREYAVLETKSIFVKGHAADTTIHYLPNSGSANPSPTPARSASPVLFNGVIDANDGFEALLEDSGSGRISTVKIGDAVQGSGKVTSLTLDTLQYVSAGKTFTVKIGQTLDGSQASAPSISTSGPSDSSNDVPSDIIERLKRKRAAELGASPPPAGG